MPGSAPDYVFMTDSDSDLPYRYVDELDISMVYMPYMLDGQEHLDDLGRGGRQKEFFENMRRGAVPVTSLLPTAVYVEYFEPYFRAGKNILFLAFSSQLSATINNIYAAREDLKVMYPDRRLVVVDTLSISAPQYILILRAYELYRQGKPLDEVAAWTEENKLKTQAWVTVEDLKYLRRGGRISAVAATMGTMMDLKPIIVESREGKMVSADKVRGRKAALRYIADKTAENILNPEDQTLVIIHGDALEDAARLETLIRDRIPGLKAVEIMFVGPVIGAHCGPGTVASCFLGRERPL